MLKTIDINAIPSNSTQVYGAETLDTVREMIERIRHGGESVVREYGEHHGDLTAGQPLMVESSALNAAFDGLPETEREALTRVANRIRQFAHAQKESLSALAMDVPGGQVGHDVVPVDVAGCYAPGGRYPLPSTVFMTVIPAKVAGVGRVLLASPKPTVHTLAAAYLAGADAVYQVGGAQAIAGMAFGHLGGAPANVLVGPGNRFVAAAKELLAAEVRIDMLAGPSELMVVADETADPNVVAIDLLAQAEHDTDATPVLVATSAQWLEAVKEALTVNVEQLPEANQINARAALDNGWSVVVESIDQAVTIANDWAPEHLELCFKGAADRVAEFKNCGAVFIGSLSAEVLGDYSAGPNHTLPTGGVSKQKAGLSVLDFLRVRTWINITDAEAAKELYEDAAILGRMEGLEGHARSAEARLSLGDA